MNELAAVIASLAALVTAGGGVILAFSVLIPIRRNAAQAVKSVAEVHTMVNQQRTDMQRYTATLVDALHAAGVPVPLDQSLETPGS